MTPPTTANATIIASTASGSRSRPQARKKPSDDAAYFGPPGGAVGTGSTNGAKRHAADKVDGEVRVKRKRGEAGARKSDRERDRLAADGDTKISLVGRELGVFLTALTRYLRLGQVLQYANGRSTSIPGSV